MKKKIVFISIIIIMVLGYVLLMRKVSIYQNESCGDYSKIVETQWSGKVNINDNYELEYLKVAFALGLEPQLLGFFVDSSNNVYNFSATAYEDTSNLKITQLKWINGVFECERLTYLDMEKGYAQDIKFDEENNTFYLNTGKVTIYNSEREKIQVIKSTSEATIEKFFIEEEFIFVLDEKNLVIRFNWKNNEILESFNLDSIVGEICLFKDYVFSFDKDSILIYYLNGDLMTSIKLPKDYDESANLIGYNNEQIYFVDENNIYEADLSDSEFELIISDKKTLTDLKIGEGLTFSATSDIAIDNEGNIYISGLHNMEEGFVVRYLKK